MKLLSIPILLALLAMSSAASAQMFKWVDEKGVTHFSDQPPPPNQKKSELKAAGSNASGPALPFELASAARNHPVVLYTASPCGACDQGRSLLNARGIPFAEKTISTEEDNAQLTAAGGNGQLPFLLVGRKRITGFEASGWNNALNDASYPTSRMLPSNYRNQRAEAAAGRPAAPEAAKPDPAQVAAAAVAAAAAEAANIKRLPPVDAAKPDFQF
jgi:glutaredoxin